MDKNHSLENYIELVEMAHTCRVLDFYRVIRSLGCKINGKKPSEKSITIREFLENELRSKNEEELIFTYLYSTLIETDRGYGLSLSQGLVMEILTHESGLPPGYEILYAPSNVSVSWRKVNEHKLLTVCGHPELHYVFVLLSLTGTN